MKSRIIQLSVWVSYLLLISPLAVNVGAQSIFDPADPAGTINSNVPNQAYEPDTCLVKFYDDVDVAEFEPTNQAKVKTIKPLFTQLVSDPRVDNLDIKTRKNIFTNRLQNVKVAFSVRQHRAVASSAVPNLITYYKIKFEEAAGSAARVCQELSQDENVEQAQVNYYMKAYQGAPAPLAANTPVQPYVDDPYFHSSGSWGQSYDDLWNIKRVKAHQVWGQYRGNGMVIAVVDSGVDHAHQDMAANIWQNPGEIPGNGVDDDGNGFIDDTFGWDFVNNDNDPMDDYGHGTHVAGIAAAVGYNATGVIGVAPQAKMMVLKGIDGTGTGLTDELAEGIVYAAMNGADVINNSWGCVFQCQSNPVAESAVQTAYGLGAVVIFAAGNNGDNVAFYSPQNMAETITVGSTDFADDHSDYSNHGAEIDVVAPGGEDGLFCSDFAQQNILSVRSGTTDFYDACGPEWIGEMVVGGNYYRAKGTSVSAPHVAGISALILEKTPSFTNEDVRQVLRVSAVDVEEEGFDFLTGFGRVDAKQALSVSSILNVSISSPVSGTYISSLDNTIVIEGTAAGAGFVQYELFYRRLGHPSDWVSLGPPSSTPVVDGVLGTMSIATIPTDSYLLKVVATDGAGNSFEDTVEILIIQGLSAVSIDPAAQFEPGGDGARIVYEDFRHFNREIYLFDHATGQEYRITNIGAEKRRPMISGDLVVWADERNGNYDIYYCFFDVGTGTCPNQQLTISSTDQRFPRVFGNRITWTDVVGAGNTNVYYCDYNIGNGTCPPVQLTSANALQQESSVDGDYIAWTDTRFGDAEIYLYHVPSAIETRITFDPANQSYVDVSGDYMVWNDYRHSGASLNSEIYIYHIPTGVEKRVTFDPLNQLWPTMWGNTVAWKDERGGNDNVYMYDIDVDAERFLTIHPSTQWTPDTTGDKVFWPDFRNGNFDIYQTAITPVDLEVKITAPVLDEFIEVSQSPIAITGTADGSDFVQYQLFYGAGLDPQEWVPITPPVSSAVQGGTLGTFDITNLKSDVHHIKLLVTAANGVEFQHVVPVLIENVIQITTNTDPQVDPAISGDYIVWQDHREGGANLDVYLYDLETMQEVPLVNGPEYEGSPVISGNRVVWKHDPGGFTPESLYYCDVDPETYACSAQLVTGGNGQVFRPAVDNNYVVWKDGRFGADGEIFLYDINTQQEHQLTSAVNFQDRPDVSGNLIVWEDKRNGNYDIYLCKFDPISGNCPELQITTDGDVQLEPTIDENRVVWQDSRNGTVDLWYCKYDETSHTCPEQPILMPGAQQHADLSGDVVVFRDTRNYATVGYAQIYFYNFATLEDGPMSIGQGPQVDPSISGSRVVWEDERNGSSNEDIYMSELE